MEHDYNHTIVNILPDRLDLAGRVQTTGNKSVVGRFNSRGGFEYCELHGVPVSVRNNGRRGSSALIHTFHTKPYSSLMGELIHRGLAVAASAVSTTCLLLQLLGGCSSRV